MRAGVPHLVGANGRKLHGRCRHELTCAAVLPVLWHAAGLSALALLAQALVQAAFLLGAPGLGAAAPFLRLLGFPPGQDLAGALLVGAGVLVQQLRSGAAAAMPDRAT